MGTRQKYMPFFASALLMCIMIFFIYPHYQYYVDPDGTSYLTISRRYAKGDFFTAINAYWSPWACWLTAILIQQGLAAITASVIVNTLGAVGFLFISQSFFIRFNIMPKLQWLLNITLALFLCFAVFYQSFDDLWECFFLLSTLRITLADGFKNDPALWIVCGFIGALAYFAKAYSFPFFILNTICCTYFICKDNKAQWIKISLTAIGVMMLCSLPWIWLLHDKYRTWTTSTAGSLNMSWYLVGHPYWQGGIGYLVPPFYRDSPYYWEDPWFANGLTPHFWDSWHLLGLQFIRIGLNIWKFIVSSFQLSAFFIVVVGYVKWILLWKRGVALTKDQRVLMLSLLLFPLGYVLVNFESRYLWYMVPLAMVVGGVFIRQLKDGMSKNILLLVFPVSFLIYPAMGMIKMYDEGKNEYNIAQQLKEAGIRGTFTSNAKPGLETQRIVRLAYFSGNPCYVAPKPGIPQKELLKEIRKFNINYFFAVGVSNQNIPLDENGQPFPELHIDGIKDITILKLN